MAKLKLIIMRQKEPFDLLPLVEKIGCLQGLTRWR